MLSCLAYIPILLYVQSLIGYEMILTACILINAFVRTQQITTFAEIFAETDVSALLLEKILHYNSETLVVIVKAVGNLAGASEYHRNMFWDREVMASLLRVLEASSTAKIEILQVVIQVVLQLSCGKASPLHSTRVLQTFPVLEKVAIDLNSVSLASSSLPGDVVDQVRCQLYSLVSRLCGVKSTSPENDDNVVALISEHGRLLSSLVEGLNNSSRKVFDSAVMAIETLTNCQEITIIDAFLSFGIVPALTVHLQNLSLRTLPLRIIRRVLAIMDHIAAMGTFSENYVNSLVTNVGFLSSVCAVLKVTHDWETKITILSIFRYIADFGSVDHVNTLINEDAALAHWTLFLYSTEPSALSLALSSLYDMARKVVSIPRSLQFVKNEFVACSADQQLRNLSEFHHLVIIRSQAQDILGMLSLLEGHE